VDGRYRRDPLPPVDTLLSVDPSLLEHIIGAPPTAVINCRLTRDENAHECEPTHSFRGYLMALSSIQASGS
jgi:hypothetical protein